MKGFIFFFLILLLCLFLKMKQHVGIYLLDISRQYLQHTRQKEKSSSCSFYNAQHQNENNYQSDVNAFFCVVKNLKAELVGKKNRAREGGTNTGLISGCKSIIVILTNQEEMKQTSEGKRCEVNANVKLISFCTFPNFRRSS